MKVLITGATGFIGRHLGLKLAERGDTIRVVTRSVSSARKLPFPFEAIEADLTRNALPEKALEGVDVVFHLMGEPVSGRRWSAEQKQKILESRTRSSQHLLDGVRKNPGIKALVSASAIGFYGAQPSESDVPLTESSAAGSDFLAQVTQAWEKETLKKIPGLRQVAIRIGLVLGRESGVLEKMLPLYRTGLGGRLGSGRQWMSWIHIDDLVGLFIHAADNSKMEGAVNGVAPHPVRNSEFSNQLARQVGGHEFLPVPKVALRLSLGEMESMVVASQRITPEAVTQAGYQFKFPQLEPALADLVSTPLSPGADEWVSEQWVPQAVEKIFPFFAEARNLEAITPPWLHFEVLNQSTPEIQTGTLINYKLKIHGVPASWRSKIEDWEFNRKFVDTQQKGPYAFWHHTHTFEPLQGGTLLRDRIIFKVPGGLLGRGLLGAKIRRDVREIFNYRFDEIEKKFGGSRR